MTSQLVSKLRTCVYCPSGLCCRRVIIVGNKNYRDPISSWAHYANWIQKYRSNIGGDAVDTHKDWLDHQGNCDILVQITRWGPLKKIIRFRPHYYISSKDEMNGFIHSIRNGGEVNHRSLIDRARR